jgi:pimeloyl-ACP methyl ester carboxylesterase
VEAAVGDPSPETEGISAHQMYGLYVPGSYHSDTPSAMTVWLHWRGPGDHQAAYYVPNMIQQLGEDRDNVIVSPRGRGNSGWYVGDSQVDVLDAMNDAERFLSIDLDRVYVAGYSMGGWGAYMFGMMYPDRFAGAFSTVGPPSIGFWAYPLAPSMDENGRPRYFTNPMVGNARHLPYVIYAGTDDELVPITGVAAQAQTFRNNLQPYQFYVFPGYEHFSFALGDEWTTAQQYLGNRTRVHNPATVTYSRLPCLDPVNWSPLYDEVADSAYWVSDIAVQVQPSAAECISQDTAFDRLNTTGTVDVTSHGLDVAPEAGAPTVGACTPPGHTTACVMTGYEPAAGPALARANVLDVTLTNVAALTVDGARAGLQPCVPLTVNSQADGIGTLRLAGLDGMQGGAVTLDGAGIGVFGGALTLPPGQHQLEVTPPAGCVPVLPAAGDATGPSAGAVPRGLPDTAAGGASPFVPAATVAVLVALLPLVRRRGRPAAKRESLG